MSATQTSTPYCYLDDTQIESFLNHGYLVIKNAFTREKAADWTKDVWTRLGVDPHDPKTYPREWTNMPARRSESIQTFSPKAWGAICELVGGEDRIAEHTKEWNDGLIVNLGMAEYIGKPPPHAKELDRWHCDGDFFLHFLDSPEQALLVVPIFTDIAPHGGGTMIAPKGVDLVARHLAARPEGVMPTVFPFRDFRDSCTEFVELTGEVGDVVLLHPFMLHSASRNTLGQPRIITNPPIAIKEPFQFSRPDARYSLVEQKTLRALGKGTTDGYDFVPTAPRQEVVPERLKVQAAWKKEEEERLARAASIPT